MAWISDDPSACTTGRAHGAVASILWVSVILSAGSCAKTATTSTPTPAAPKAPATATEMATATAAPTAATSLDAPIARCGTTDSYAFIATEFRCPDGTNPFEGDTLAARQARIGSQRSERTGHHVDRYDVPCGSETIPVFVDMYGCPAMEDDLARSTVPPELTEAFAAGDFETLWARCLPVLEGRVDEGAQTWMACTIYESALRIALGKDYDGALQGIGSICGAMAPQSTARLEYATEVLRALIAALQIMDVRDDERQTIVDDSLPFLSAACGVDAREIVQGVQDG